MTDKEKFLEYINSENNFCSKHGFGNTYEFVCFEFMYGIVKQTSILKSGSIYVKYLLYVTRYLPHDKIDFVIVKLFNKLENAEKTLKLLTLFD